MKVGGKLQGWLFIYNPSKNIVGFKVHSYVTLFFLKIFITAQDCTVTYKKYLKLTCRKYLASLQK